VSYGDDVDAETALDRAARQAAAITIELGWQRYLDRRTFARMKEAMYQAVSGSARALTQTRTPHASTRTQKHTTTTTTATTKTSTFCRLSHLMTTWVPPNARYLDYCENLCVWFVTLSHTSLLANLRRVPLLMRCCGSCVLSRLLCSRRRYCSQESGSGEGRASHRHFVTTLNRPQPSLAIHTISNGTHPRHSVSCHPTQPINSSACSWMMLRLCLARTNYMMHARALMNTPRSRTQIAGARWCDYRLAGDSFPPRVVFKVYVSRAASSVVYFSGKRVIKAGSHVRLPAAPCMLASVRALNFVACSAFFNRQ
jgi:hypothetical protein